MAGEKQHSRSIGIRTSVL